MIHIKNYYIVYKLLSWACKYTLENGPFNLMGPKANLNELAQPKLIVCICEHKQCTLPQLKAIVACDLHDLWYLCSIE